MTRKLLAGAVLMMALVLLAVVSAGPVQAQGTVICPDDTLNWLVPTQGALQPGGSLNCRPTAESRVWSIPQQTPEGYEYAYPREQGYGYYDIIVFGQLDGPIELCMRGIEGAAGQTLAVWSGVPNQWYLLPSFRSGDSVCAQTERIGGVTLLRTPGNAPADAGVSTGAEEAAPAAPATPEPAALPSAGESSAGVDLSITAGEEETCLVRTKYIVRLRAEPNTQSAILDRVPWQTPMQSDLRLADGTWMRVDYFGVIGWINTRFLEQSAACDRLAIYTP